MSEELASKIIQVSVLLMVGIAVLSGVVTSATSTMTPAVSVITFADNPADAETITLGDSTPMVFEFNNSGNITEGHWEVTIGATVAETIDNTVASMDTNTGYIITHNDTSITIDGMDASPTTTATNITVAATAGSGLSSLLSSVTGSINSGYVLLSLLVLILGAGGIMKYLNFI